MSSEPASDLAFLCRNLSNNHCPFAISIREKNIAVQHKRVKLLGYVLALSSLNESHQSCDQDILAIYWWGFEVDIQSSTRLWHQNAQLRIICAAEMWARVLISHISSSPQIAQGKRNQEYHSDAPHLFKFLHHDRLGREP